MADRYEVKVYLAGHHPHTYWPGGSTRSPEAARAIAKAISEEGYWAGNTFYPPRDVKVAIGEDRSRAW